MIVLGRVTGPFGILGWLRIHPFGDDPLAWGEMKQWWLSNDPDAADSAWKPYSLAGLKAHGGEGVVARLKEVPDRTAAEAMIGFYIGAPREALPDNDPDEFYWADLVGLAVTNTAGEALGEVTEIIAGAANDVISVKDDAGKQRLLPFVEAVVKEVDTVGRRMVVEWGSDWD